ncbi:MULTISPECIES: hypothetical protein [unclassified Clostridium]|uniref:transposase-like zinc-binding domain-containing protein n=1 Tax=unclassified Clostridium TaxID=2614128 RepID=UPI000297D004|nr:MULTISPECIES: hypothetical protein [unclassified Clostridium]EKQ56767.1 MAG: hypothetical protein A370_01542 [Clostridium sp. Maddingley MBC34-26]
MIRKDKKFKQLESFISILLKNDVCQKRNIESCPNCLGHKFIKYGSFKGIQRYKCKECKKTFSKTTNFIWSYSKKEPIKWIKFVEYVLERKSLRFCAKKLNISLVTAFYWRHKILHGLLFDSVPNQLIGNVYISKKLIPENFKGSRKINTHVRHNIWVVSAKGCEDSMIATSISKGFWDLRSFNKKIYHLIDKKSYLVPYGDRYISLVAKSHNKEHTKKVKDEIKIKFFSNNLEKWLKKYHGIATKYLEEYLSLFILFNLHKKFSSLKLFNTLSFDNRFLKISEIGIE